MSVPKLLLVDRDGVLNLNSSDPDSPFYYILRPANLILKPGVAEAFSIISAARIPTLLVTKQRCVGKGLLARGDLEDIHWSLQIRLDFKFADILVEESAPDKSALYARIIDAYRGIQPREMLLLDDSAAERKAAETFGIHTIDGTNLFAAVCEIFEISP